MPFKKILNTTGSSVRYNANFLSKKEADDLYRFLETLEYQKLTVVMFGNETEVKRRAQAFATDDTYAEYKYTGSKSRAKTPLPRPFKVLRKKINRTLNFKPNYVLVNRYSDATVGIGAHSDDEPAIVPGSPIVGLSIGRAARFVFHPKKGGKRVAEQVLTHGSAVVMKGQCQSEFKHSIPAEKKEVSAKYPPQDVGLEAPTNVRYSLTFRKNKPSKK